VKEWKLQETGRERGRKVESGDSIVDHSKVNHHL